MRWYDDANDANVCWVKHISSAYTTKNKFEYGNFIIKILIYNKIQRMNNTSYYKSCEKYWKYNINISLKYLIHITIVSKIDTPIIHYVFILHLLYLHLNSLFSPKKM